MSARYLEAAFIAVIMLAVLVGGRAWVVDVAQFHGLAVSLLGAIAIVLVYAFRRNYVTNAPGARLSATRDAAFLAAIAAAVAFTLSPARWSLGATVVALELGLLVELLGRFAPGRPAGVRKDR